MPTQSIKLRAINGKMKMLKLFEMQIVTDYGLLKFTFILSLDIKDYNHSTTFRHHADLSLIEYEIISNH